MPQEITNFYRNAAIIFVLIAIIVFAGLFYFNMAKAVVVITSSTTKLPTEMIIDVKELPFEPSELAENEVFGRIFEMVRNSSATFESTGAKHISKEDTVGKVTIINNYSKEQILIATTRLLSSNGILLRIKNDVTVSAGEKVVVDVYPDNADTFTELEPTSFKIPGLWEGLQDKIYAESSIKMTKEGYEVKVVKEEDLIAAQKHLEGQIYKNTLKEVEGQLSITEKLHTKIINRETTVEETQVTAGTEVEEFGYTLKLKMIIVVFDEKKLIKVVEERLKNELPAGKQLIGIDSSSLTYNIEKYDMQEKVVNLKVKSSSLSALTDESGIFSKDDLANLSEQDVVQYFSQYQEIEKVEVKFTPSWVKKMPSSAKRIKIEIK